MESDFLTLRLVDNYGRVYSDLSYMGSDSLMMYRYKKLVFDGVELSDTGDGKYPEWIRLEIFINGQSQDKPFAMVPVYENNEVYNIFED